MSRINEGDTGTVNKDDAGTTLIRRAEVIKTPAGEGDVWGFRDLDTGREIFTTEKFTFYRDTAKANGQAQARAEDAEGGCSESPGA